MTAPSHPSQTQSFETLDIQVRGLEGDVRELKDGIAGLDAKIDKSIASLAHEVRSAVSALTNQFTERQRTPWGVLISAAMAIVAVLGVVGNQAIGPVNEAQRILASKLERMEEHLVPRVEHQVHWEAEDARYREMTVRIQRQWDQQMELARRLAYHEGQHNPVK